METPHPDLLARLAAEALLLDATGPIRIHLDATQALQLVGLVQLALRHPAVDKLQEAPDFGRQFIDDVRDLYRAAGAETFAELVELGNNPALDEPAAPRIIVP